MSKTLTEIKNEIAQKYGFKYWSTVIYWKDKEQLMTEICQRVHEEACKAQREAIANTFKDNANNGYSEVDRLIFKVIGDKMNSFPLVQLKID